jgi:rod shape-determining protein MreC
VEEFFGRYRNLSVLMAVVFAQIILLGYQVRTERGSRLLREWTVRGVTPITKSVRGLTQWVSSSWENYCWLVDTKQDNDRLRRELEQLKLENVGLRSNLARFEREEKLVDYQGDLASKTILAQVIGKGANSNSREIFISRGLDAGVTAGMAVITPDGIVGKVQASYAGAALVMLISDPEAGAGVLLGRSRAPGILKGTGHAQCRIDYVSHEVDVAVGETVYTSGDDRVFPKGLRVGEVTRMQGGTDFQQIYLKPFAQLDRLEEVLVITLGVHQDLPDSPQAQPPQFLMPLPAEEADPLRAVAAPSEQAPAAADAVPAAEQTEPNGRLTDADRLRQYYQSIAAQQGHRIGYGGPGTPPPEFNPERLRSHRAAAGAAAPSAAAPVEASPQPPSDSAAAQTPAAEPGLSPGKPVGDPGTGRGGPSPAAGKVPARTEAAVPAERGGSEPPAPTNPKPAAQP